MLYPVVDHCLGLIISFQISGVFMSFKYKIQILLASYKYSLIALFFISEKVASVRSYAESRVIIIIMVTLKM